MLCLVGMFYEDLFLYHDDVDYAWKLRLLGYKCACIVDAKAYHWYSATLGLQNPRVFYFLTRNNIWVIAKNSTLAWFLLRLFLMMIEVLTGYLRYVLLKRKNGKAALFMLRGILESLINLSKAFSKRVNIIKFRKVKETEINKLMNILTDVDMIFPRKLWKVLGFKR